jgi:uncharacterized membrane protein
VNVIDKLVLTKWMRRPIGSTVMFVLVETAAGVAAFVIGGFPVPETGAAVAALAAGLCFGLMVLFYFRAAKEEEITRVAPMYDLVPILTLLFAAAFLGERLAPQAYFGVILVAAGAFLVSSRSGQGFRLSPAAGWLLLSVLALAASAVIVKAALDRAPEIAVFAWSRFGVGLLGIPVVLKGWPALYEAVRRHGRPVLIGTLASESLTALVSLLYIAAAARGPVSLVGAMVGTHPFFLLLFAAALSAMRPGLLKEDIATGPILRKAAGIALIFAGSLLVI